MRWTLRWDIGLSRAKTGSLAGPLHTKALEERPASPQDGATKPDKNGGRRLLLTWIRQILDGVGLQHADPLRLQLRRPGRRAGVPARSLASLRRGPAEAARSRLAAHELRPDAGGDEQAAGAGSLAARTNPEVASGPGSSEIGWVSCSRTATCRWFS